MAPSEDFAEAAEGRLLTRVHIVRERNGKLVQTKTKTALKSLGHLRCEACQFDFGIVYGSRGSGFIECHHIKPVSTLTEGQKTHIDDLALLCSNCHRMIHRGKPWITVDELKRIIEKDS